MLTTVVLVMLGVLSIMIYGQKTCQLTEADVLGPYYLPNAPISSEQLCENTPANDRLILTGQVVDYDSRCTRAIPYVKLDLWQANFNGVYSSGKDKSEWFCRGVFHTDANGKFRITTIMPGRYNDNGYRPAHIHFNITVRDYPQLITQLYFSHDYYLSSRDSCRQCRSNSNSLVVSVNHRNDIKTYEGDWTIVLSKRARVSASKFFDKTTEQDSYIQIREHIMD